MRQVFTAAWTKAAAAVKVALQRCLMIRVFLMLQTCVKTLQLGG